MKRILIAILALALVSMACAAGAATPKPSLYPSPTILPTQTPYIVEVTTTPVPTLPPVIVQVTPTPGTYCVASLVSVHMRPSPNEENYPITVLSNGARVIDLGGRTGKWYFVQYGNQQGWVHSDYLGNCP